MQLADHSKKVRNVHFNKLKYPSIQMWTADCGLDTMQSEGKTQAADLTVQRNHNAISITESSVHLFAFINFNFTNYNDNRAFGR